jgi:SRSO17 transposase
MAMDADTILRIKPALTEYLKEFDDCFGRVTTRRHLDTYVEGQLSDLARKSVEPIADAAGVPPRTLQEFLGLFRWDEARVRDRLQERVARHHAHPAAIGVLDETSFPKKGAHTAGVQRQYCGASGKTDNCVVSVHLGYAAGDFHTLLDGELYLPRQTWHADRARCRAAGIPDDVGYRSKWQIGLGQIRRALANGLRFAWMTFDEGYGGKPPFLRALDAVGLNYVGELPSTFHVWTKRPAVRYRQHARERGPGRPPRYPRLKAKSNPTVEVRHVLGSSPRLRAVPWVRYHVKDGAKGPEVWEAKALRVWLKDERGLPTAPHVLVVARQVLSGQVKYFLANVPEAPTETLLAVAFSRWHIERAFEDSKGELGMDHFEVRHWRAIQRHLVLSAVSHLFLAEFQEAHGGKKSGPDALPGPRGHRRPGAGLDPRRPLLPPARRGHRHPPPCHPTTQRPRGPLPPTPNPTSPARYRRVLEGYGHLSTQALVAL